VIKTDLPETIPSKFHPFGIRKSAMLFANLHDSGIFLAVFHFLDTRIPWRLSQFKFAIVVRYKFK